MHEQRKTRGLVVLAGAGPGDPELFTPAGAKWLSRADVVIYDRLANPVLLRMCRPDAKLISVGKTPGQPGPKQQEINDLLLEHGRGGGLVVRLKGGDPFIFGRGGEEADVLRAAGIPCRVVPGITAAIAAGAYAGIPLTDRRHASTLAFVTGQQDPDDPKTHPDWAALARIDTVVFYMGIKNLPEIVENLMQNGRDGKTPTAVVAAAATPRQKTVTAPLKDIVATVKAAGIKPPAITIVGNVVALRERIAWLEDLPLFGQTVLLTRPARQARHQLRGIVGGQAGELAGMLSELGANVIEAPAVEIRPPSDTAALEAVLRRLETFSLVVFTSVNGVAAFVERCRAAGLDGRALGRAKVAAIGPATARALRESFIQPDVMPEVFTTAALAEALAAGIRPAGGGGLSAKAVLLWRADLGNPQLAAALRSAGAAVEDVACYHSVRPDALPAEAIAALREKTVNWIVFTSSSTVTNFLSLLRQACGDEAVAGLLTRVKLAAIGPVTAQTLREAGFAPAVVAAESTNAGLVQSMVDAAGSGNAS